MSEEQKQEEKQSRKAKVQKGKLLKNIKYKGKYFTIGEEIEVDAKDVESFIKAGIIVGD